MAKFLRLPLRRTLHWAGSALALLGITFVALRLRNYSAALDFSRFDTAGWLVIAGFVLLYGLSNLMLAQAWWNLLAQFRVHISRRWALKIFGISQLAKYVPGNIFHLAGRQAMGMAAGMPGWMLAKSSVWELGLISFAGATFGLLALPLLIPGLPFAISAIGFAASVVIVIGLLWRFVGLPAAHSFGCYVSFLAISGLLFTGLIALQCGAQGISNFKWLPLCGAYVLAWLIGLVTPGAPAGIGVRELVLLFLLKGEISEMDLIMVVLLGRAVTVSGDMLVYLGSLLMSPDNNPSEFHE